MKSTLFPLAVPMIEEIEDQKYFLSSPSILNWNYLAIFKLRYTSTLKSEFVHFEQIDKSIVSELKPMVNRSSNVLSKQQLLHIFIWIEEVKKFTYYLCVFTVQAHTHTHTHRAQ